MPLFKLKWEVTFFFQEMEIYMGVYDLGCPGNVGSGESEGSVSYYLGLTHIGSNIEERREQRNTRLRNCVLTRCLHTSIFTVDHDFFRFGWP